MHVRFFGPLGLHLMHFMKKQHILNLSKTKFAIFQTVILNLFCYILELLQFDAMSQVRDVPYQFTLSLYFVELPVMSNAKPEI